MCIYIYIYIYIYSAWPGGRLSFEPRSKEADEKAVVSLQDPGRLSRGS